jgi:hypothetical protein
MILFLLALVLNGVLLVDNQKLDRKTKWKRRTELVIYAANGILFFISFSYICLISTIRLPLMIINSRNKNKSIGISELVKDYSKLTLSFYWHFLCVIGWIFSPYFMTLHLIPCLNLFESTQFIMT